MPYPGRTSPAPAPIGGPLPWGGPNPGAAFGTSDPAAIGAAYTGAYNNALAMNQSNYANILSGYQSTLAAQTTAQQAIGAGYTGLYNDVLARIDSIGTARANAINAASARSLASGSQQLIDRGLGNTTVQSSLNRGVEADRNARQLELSDSLARTTGDYMSQLGLAGLSSQQRGLENQTALQGRQLDFMNSVKSSYPDAGLYSSLAQTAAQTAALNRYGGGVFAQGQLPGPSSGRLGYVSGPTPNPGGGGSGFEGGGYPAGPAAGYSAPRVNDLTPGGYTNPYAASGYGSYQESPFGSDAGSGKGYAGEGDSFSRGPDVSQSIIPPSYYQDYAPWGGGGDF